MTQLVPEESSFDILKVLGCVCREWNLRAKETRISKTWLAPWMLSSVNHCCTLPLARQNLDALAFLDGMKRIVSIESVQ